MALQILVVDALARASGRRYATFDVVGAGPRVVAGVLDGLGHIVRLKTYEDVMANISNYLKYDLILISAMSSDRGALHRLVQRLRGRGFKGLIIVGGPISFEYKELLKSIPEIDLVVIGEAEIPLMKMFSGGEDLIIGRRFGGLREVPALAYRIDHRVVKTSPHIHTPSEIMSSIKPWTRIDQSYPVHRIYRYYVEVVRGCSNYHRPLINGYPGLNCIKCMLCYNMDLSLRLNCPVNIPPGCGFCSVPYQFGSPRSRSIESIVREIEGLITYGARRIVLSGPDFLDYMREELVKPKPLTDPCAPPPNIDKIEELLNSLYSIPEVSRGKAVIMVENIKACLVDEEVAKTMGKYLKDTTIHIGMETGDYEFNKLIGKPIGPQHVYKAVKLLRKYGLRPYIYLMYGLPFMRPKTYMKTIDSIHKLRELGVEKITLYKFTPLPYTAFSRIKPETRRYKGLIARLKKIVDEYNMVMKKILRGRRVEAFLLYSNGRYYAYPVKHGPTIFVKGLGSPDFNGCRALIEIIDIAPRYVYGKLVEVIDC